MKFNHPRAGAEVLVTCTQTLAKTRRRGASDMHTDTSQDRTRRHRVMVHNLADLQLLLKLVLATTSTHTSSPRASLSVERMHFCAHQVNCSAK